MARFAISGDYLYTLNARDLTVFDISRPSDPLPYTKDHVAFDVETLFSYGDYLYIGTQSGLYIYNKPTVDKPMVQMSRFSHVTSCDPVVVENNLAFVTLNTGRTCQISGRCECNGSLRREKSVKSKTHPHPKHDRTQRARRGQR